MKRHWFDYVIIGGLVLAVAGSGGVIYVAVHFLAKVW